MSGSRHPGATSSWPPRLCHNPRPPRVTSLSLGNEVESLATLMPSLNQPQIRKPRQAQAGEEEAAAIHRTGHTGPAAEAAATAAGHQGLSSGPAEAFGGQPLCRTRQPRATGHMTLLTRHSGSVAPTEQGLHRSRGSGEPSKGHRASLCGGGRSLEPPSWNRDWKTEKGVSLSPTSRPLPSSFQVPSN